MAARNSAKKHPLARWRALHGLTQSQLADEADVHLTTIARIESAGQIPSVDVAIRIAAVIDTHAENIWGDPEFVGFLLDKAEAAVEEAKRDPASISRHLRDATVAQVRVATALAGAREDQIRLIQEARAAVAEVEAERGRA